MTTAVSFGALLTLQVSCTAASKGPTTGSETAPKGLLGADGSGSAGSCEFSGRFRVADVAALGFTDSSKRVLFEFRSAVVSRLTLPSDRFGSYPISISWPLIADGFLAVGHFPFSLRRRVDWKAPHLWLDENARVSAWATPNGQVRVWRPLQPRVDGPAMEFELGCSDIALTDAPTGPAPAPFGFTGSEVSLYSRPGTNAFAHFYLLSLYAPVNLLETRSDWFHVEGRLSHTTLAGPEAYVPFDFNAWTVRGVDRVGTDAESWKQWLGREDDPPAKPAPPTHRTTRPIRVAVEEGAPPFGDIAPDVMLRKEGSGNPVAVHVEGIKQMLFVAARDFERSATPLPRGTP